MKSFRDPETGILRAWGYMEANGNELARDEPEDFSLEPRKWRLVEGEWQPYVAVVVPQEVTMRQARLALLQVNLLSQVEVAINSMPSPQKETARIEWDHSQTVKRDRALVKTLGPALGLAEAQIDQLFITAATL